MTLSLEQVASGRAQLAHYEQAAADGSVGSTIDLRSRRGAIETWLLAHAEQLLDAAERVARQEAYANEPDGYDAPAAVAQRQADAERGRTEREAEEARDKAELDALLKELEPLLTKAIGESPIAVWRDDRPTPLTAWTLDMAEAWLLARGVRAVVAVRGKNLELVTAELVDYWRPRCPECAGDLGGQRIGRLENHKPDCSRFPL